MIEVPTFEEISSESLPGIIDNCYLKNDYKPTALIVTRDDEANIMVVRNQRATAMRFPTGRVHETELPTHTAMLRLISHIGSKAAHAADFTFSEHGHKTPEFTKRNKNDGFPQTLYLPVYAQFRRDHLKVPRDDLKIEWIPESDALKVIEDNYHEYLEVPTKFAFGALKLFLATQEL